MKKFKTSAAQNVETHLGVEHDLRRSVPTSGNVLRQESSVIVVGIRHTSQTKVTDLQGDESRLIL